MVVVCEPLCVGLEHVPFNAGVLRILAEAEGEVTFLADPEHLVQVQGQLGVSMPGVIRFEALEIPRRRAGFHERLLRERAGSANNPMADRIYRGTVQPRPAKNGSLPINAFRNKRFAMNKISFLLLLIALAFPWASSNALSFTPSETEWLTWPEYCRARYVDSGAGRNSEFVSRVPRDVFESWKRRMGPAWRTLRHYCAGKVYLIRARGASDTGQRRFLLEKVVGEVDYTLERTPSDSFMVPVMVATAAEALYRLGQDEEALRRLSTAMGSFPGHAGLYTTAAVIYRGADKLGKAVEVLKRGEEKTEGGTAELHYFLGLVYADLEEYPRARAHAAKAYSMGYPLPGLRNKLKAVGQWRRNTGG